MKKYPLYVISPISRPQNVPAMLASLQSLTPHFHWTWLKPEEPKQDKHGNQKRNNCLQMVVRDPNHWIRFLDDDNLLHPDWAEAAHRAIRTNRGDLILFQQLLWDGSPNPWTGTPRIENGKMDTDQMLVRASAIKGALWPLGVYEADYYFAKRVRDGGARVLFVEEAVSWYNKISQRFPNANV